MIIKNRTIIFVSFLFIIISFFIGLTFGKRIEKFNKSYAMITPYPQNLMQNPQTEEEVEPTPVFTYGFTMYTFKSCGISMFIPSDFKEFSTKKNDVTLTFTQPSETPTIRISCDDKMISDTIKALSEATDATQSAKVTKQETILGEEYNIFSYKDLDTVVLSNGDSEILLQTSPSLTELVHKTVEIE